jgi:hypothetical protein
MVEAGPNSSVLKLSSQRAAKEGVVDEDNLDELYE